MKIDLQNCFWSISLPSQVQGFFSLSSTTAVFQCRRLPFGWTWSPVLAQLFIAYLLIPLRKFPALHYWQYIDDVLLASTDPAFLTAMFSLTCDLLTKAGFLISPKSSTTPSAQITWLGKTLTSTPGHLLITNAPHNVATTILHICYLRLQLPGRKALLRLLGSLQWLGLPGSELGPWLATAYQLAHATPFPVRLPRRIYAKLLRSALLALTPVHPMKLPAPLTLPLLFVDAAPSDNSGCFRVGVVRPGSFATSIPAPGYVNTINAAELYAVLHGAEQAVKRKCPLFSLLSDSSCTYHHLVKLKCAPSLPTHAYLLLRLWKLLNKTNTHFSVSLIPSGMNPADPFSRIHQTPLPVALQIGCLRSTSFCTVPQTLTHPLWLWWRLPFLPEHA